jgi:hypothetical protein
LETGIADGVLRTENDIRNYIKLDSKGNLPKCPQGDIYAIGEIGEPPTCPLGKTSRAHVLCSVVHSIGYFFKPQSGPTIFRAQSGLFLK